MTTLPRDLPDEPDTFRIEVASIHELVDPVEQDVWGVGITWEDVQDSFENSDTHIATPVGGSSNDPKVHAGRIAWLALNGWNDPIEIHPENAMRYDMGALVVDGNHRLAAAILTGKLCIDAVILGDAEFAHALFDELPLCAAEYDEQTRNQEFQP